MTFEEFLNNGGNVDLAISAQVTASITELASASASVTGNMPVEQRMPLSNLSSEINSSGFVLDQSTMENGFSSNVQTVGKSNRSRKRNTAITSPRRTRSSRRLQGKTSATPALNFITPIPKSTTLTALTKDILITPKFDPRLPIPATRMRAPKPGERVISMTGSPLTNYVGPSNHNAPKVIIPLTGGKTFQLSVDENSSLSAQEIDVASDNVAQNNIRLLQEKLSKMLKMPK
ncbi:borealin-like [Xenia sp. Carnegie-2017]|uniref:borealin-like n=1 Tax=Xenia sp. Carnegie-2017 TaxID=2897299 RepID=UPI001F04E431|nr:borealin-like [Xenia sp. Carnegie-2017]